MERQSLGSYLQAAGSADDLVAWADAIEHLVDGDPVDIKVASVRIVLEAARCIEKTLDTDSKALLLAVSAWLEEPTEQHFTEVEKRTYHQNHGKFGVPMAPAYWTGRLACSSAGNYELEWALASALRVLLDFMSPEELRSVIVNIAK